jgi:hypothetical protein
MANTTDLMITTALDAAAIIFINEATGLDFKLISDAQICGGVKVVSFDAYATCPRCIGEEAIQKLIGVFKSAPFDYPEFAVLFIDDDDSEDFNGVLKKCSPKALTVRPGRSIILT